MNKKLALAIINLLLLNIYPDIQAGREISTTLERKLLGHDVCQAMRENTMAAPSTRSAVKKTPHSVRTVNVNLLPSDTTWGSKITDTCSSSQWDNYFASQSGLRANASEFNPRRAVVQLVQTRARNKRLLADETVFPSLDRAFNKS